MARIKYMNKAEVHHGFQYREGWNEVEVFDEEECQNGIHYTDTDFPGHVKWMCDIENVTHYRIVEESVYEIAYRDKYKARKVRLGQKRPLSDFLGTETQQLAAVQTHGYVIQHIRDPSEAVKLKAVETSGTAIRYIRDPSEAVKVAAVQQNGYAVRHISDPSETLQLAAVRDNGYVIASLPHPSEAVQLAAVRQAGLTIRYISNPSEAVQLAAVQQDRTAFYLIENPSEAVRKRSRIG